MEKRLVFFGNEKFATGIGQPRPVIRETLVSSGYEIEAQVTAKALPKHEAKLAVLAAYGKILPQSVLDEFPLGIINVHPSLLPLHRGPTPIEQVILDGATKTGVSIMKITAEMDAGPIYKQRSVKLSGRESKAELAAALQQLGAELLLEVLPGIASSSRGARRQSHPDRATYTKLIKKEDGIIDWPLPAETIARQIRAYLGWPGSRTAFGRHEVTITAAATRSHPVQGVTLQPGKPFTTPSGELAVKCGNGILMIQRLKPAGKNEMTGREFLAGYLKDL